MKNALEMNNECVQFWKPSFSIFGLLIPWPPQRTNSISRQDNISQNSIKLPEKWERRIKPTWSRIVFLFLVSVTADSCMSPIFFIFSSMSIFCSSFLISARSRRTVSSLWCWRATAVAHAEWMAVIQFSSSVWLQVCVGTGSKRSEVKQQTSSLTFKTKSSLLAFPVLIHC